MVLLIFLFQPFIFLLQLLDFILHHLLRGDNCSLYILKRCLPMILFTRKFLYLFPLFFYSGIQIMNCLFLLSNAHFLLFIFILQPASSKLQLLLLQQQSINFTLVFLLHPLHIPIILPTISYLFPIGITMDLLDLKLFF